MGIPNVGYSTSKLICKYFRYNWNDIENATFDQLIEIGGIGDIMAEGYVKFFSDEKNKIIINDILKEIELEQIQVSTTEQILENINFVITGSIEQFKNRDELKEIIESKGGKVTGSVTSKTNYLINNDNLSGSSKNKKAKELGISIITENQFVDWVNNGVRP
jgi:DNA ligase (NAD+)